MSRYDDKRFKICLKKNLFQLYPRDLICLAQVFRICICMNQNMKEIFLTLCEFDQLTFQLNFCTFFAKF